MGPVTKIAESVLSVANAFRGVIDSFHGDHFVISFNVAKPNPEGPQKSARCALELIKRNPKGAKCAIGIATGRAIVGNLGTATLKRLSVIGPVYTKAMSLARLCRRFHANSPAQLHREHASTASILERLWPVQCLLEKAMAAEAQHLFTLQALGGIYGAPFAQVATATEQLNYLKTIEGNALSVEGERNDAVANVNVNKMVLDLTALNRKQSNPSPMAPLPSPVEMLFALRPSETDNIDDDGGAGDEWLYELSANCSNALSEVNRAMSTFVGALPCSQISLETLQKIGGIACNQPSADCESDASLDLPSASAYIDALLQFRSAVREIRESHNRRQCPAIGHSTTGAQTASEDNTDEKVEPWDESSAIFEIALRYCEFICETDLKRVSETHRQAPEKAPSKESTALAYQFSRLISLEPRDAVRGCFFTGSD